MMNSQMEAEDMLQEAFTEAFRKLDTFRYESTFGAWLKRIVINKCINEIKRKKAELSFVEDIGIYGDREESEDYNAELSVAEIKKAMGQLPDGNCRISHGYISHPATVLSEKGFPTSLCRKLYGDVSISVFGHAAQLFHFVCTRMTL